MSFLVKGAKESKKTNCFSENQNKAKEADTDTEKDTDTDTVTDTEKDIKADKPQNRTRFVVPTIEEIQAYCSERNNSVDAQRFYDYYTANGWKVGKNAMKDWKAAVRTWERNGYSNATNQSEVNPYAGMDADCII